MPEHRALQIVGSLIHILIERDLVDPALALGLHGVAKGLGDRDLLFVGHLQAAEEDHSAVVQSGANGLGFPAAEQRVEVGPELAADPRREVDDFQLRGGKSHSRQLTLVRMVLAECFTRGCFHNSTASETVISE